jgi:choline transporter-like protein 2/4/5
VGVDEAMGLFYPNGTTTGTAEGLDLPSSLHPTLRQTLTDGQFWGRLFGDMWTARNYVLGVGFGLSIAVGLVYVRLLRVPCLLPFMVWGSIALGCGVVLYAGYYARTLALRWEAADPPTHPQQNIDAVRTASYLLWAAGTVLVAMFVCLFQRLVLSMKCVKKTGRALGAMPLIVLFPVVQALGLAAFLGVFLAYGICLAGMGTMSTRTHEVGAAPFQYSVSVRTFQYEDPVEYAGWYLLFVLFWTSQFVVAVGEIVIAMAVSRWYFARDKKRINSGAVWSSLTATLRCHAGTAAFGALIIAVVKLIRAGVAKLQTEAKRMDAKTAQILLCLFQCVIWLFEKVLRFFNQQAYVQTAIFGTGFFVSAREGFFLAARNAGRVAAIAYVSGMTALVGKFVIVAVTAAMGYVAMQNHLGDEIYSAVGPTFLVAVISYFVAGMFMAIFDTCATTVLHCFIADEEMFGDDPGGRYAEEKLVAFVDKHGSEEATYASDGEEDSLD